MVLFSRLCLRVANWLTYAKLLHDPIISLRGEASIQDSAWSRIYVLRISILLLYTIFYCILKLFRQCDIFCFCFLFLYINATNLIKLYTNKILISFKYRSNWYTKQKLLYLEFPKSFGNWYYRINLYEEEFGDTKGAIRIRISKKNKQHNGQKKKDKRKKNEQQNIHIKLKIE